MPLYSYIVITKNGQRITGEKESDSKETLANYLISKDLTVVSINERISFNVGKLSEKDIGGVPLKDKVVLIRQLGTMISAGIPLIQALDILIQQTDKKSIKAKLENIYKLVESGTALGEAFSREKGLLTEVQVNLLRSGEESGNLNEMLNQIALDMEKSKSLRGKIVGALIYPIIIFVVIIVVLLIMILVMVPQVKSLYESFGQGSLPFVTEVLISIGNFLTDPVKVIFIIILIVSAFLTFRYINSTPGGRLKIDGIKLRVPIFGNLMIRKMEVVQFCRILSMLLNSGIPIIDAIDIVAKALNNSQFTTVLLKSKEEVIKGTSLSLAIAKFNASKVYPLVLVRIMSVGEESGKLEKVLEDIGKFFENEVEQITNNLTKLMEPLIMVIVGVVVGFMAVAIYLPIFQITQYIK